MIAASTQARSIKRRLNRALGLSLCLLLFVGALMAPSQAMAVCPGTAETGSGKVLFQSCTVGFPVSASADALNIAYPGSINAGDVLLLTVGVKNQVGIYTPAGFVRVMHETRAGSTLGVYRRIADGTESGNLFVDWTGPYWGQAVMTRFTQATGRFDVEFDTTLAARTDPPTPALSTNFAGYKAVRIGVVGGEVLGNYTGSIMSDSAHVNLHRASAPEAGISPSNAMSLVMAQQDLAGTAATSATIRSPSSIAPLTATIALEHGTPGTPTLNPPALDCARGSDPLLNSSQVIEFVGCTGAGRAVNSSETALSISKPTGVVVGDFLIAMMSVGNDDAPVAPTGWTQELYSVHLNEGAPGSSVKGAGYAIYSRVATGSEPSSYGFSADGARGIAMTLIALRNTEGSLTVSSRTDNAESMLTPDVSTLGPDSLVIRTLAADDQDTGGEVVEIVPYYRNIEVRTSNNVDFGVSLQSAYTSIPATGPVRSERMYNLQDEASTLATLVIGPALEYELRFSMPDASAQVCGTQPVTLTVTDLAGNVYTDFSGTVQLSVDTVLASRTGARWLDLDGSLNGTLTSGSNGNASYTFDAADNGVAVFDFHNPNAVTHGFNAVYSVGSTDFSEPSTHDPDLTIDTDCEFRISHDGNANTCVAETITVSVVDAAGISAYAYTGTMAITTNTGKGNFSIASGSGSLSPSSDTDNNGSASYTFVSSDNASVELGFSHFDASTVNFNAADSSSGFTTDSAFDPNLAVSACQIRVVVDNASDQSDVCSIAQVTFSVTNSVGTPVAVFAGTLNISTATSTGNWSGGGVNTVNNGTADDGAASYAMVSADGGDVSLGFTQTQTAAALGFVVSGTASNGASVVQSTSVNEKLEIVSCTVDIQVDDGAGATCSIDEQVTFTIKNRLGNVATDFTGTIALVASDSRGDFEAVGGGGTFSNGTADDGAASYQYATSDNGVFVARYGNSSPGTVTVTASGTGITLATGSDGDIAFSDCEIEVLVDETDDASYMCTDADIRFRIVDSSGSLLSNFSGTVNLGTSTSNGDWSGGGENTVVNGSADDGAASYEFDTDDNGVVTLSFTHLYETVSGSDLDFVVTGVAANGASLTQSSSASESLSVAGCTVDIQVDDGEAGTCSAGETVTYTIRDGEGNVATNFAGYLVLDADTGKGDYVAVGANGTFNNAEANDGAGLYQYSLADSGVLTVRYSNGNVSTVDLTASAPSITKDSASDGEIEFLGCEFRISYPDSTPGAGDVCTVELIKIGLYDPDGTVASGYTGTANISASSGLGTWATSTASGTLVDPVADDGNFTYTFSSGDNGEATFAYSAESLGAINFDVSDGVSTDPRDSADTHDGSLTISACKFQISYDGGGSGSLHAPATLESCKVQQVTVEIYSSQGVLVTDYTGLVSISTSSNSGAWAINSAGGTLTATGLTDSGTATYQFVDADNGSVTFDYSSADFGTLTIDVSDGLSAVDSAADPVLTVTSCPPTIGTPSCAASPDRNADIAITAQSSSPANRGRLVIMLIAYSATSNVSSATFNGEPMTRIIKSQKTSTVPATVDMWGILDEDLPVAAGTYNGAYTGASNGPAMCLMFLDNVEQAFPLVDSGTPSSGAANGTFGTTNATSTTVTAPSANSVVVSGVVGGQSGGAAMDYGSVSPSTLSRVFQGPDPTASDFAGSAGIVPDEGAIEVIETRNGSSSNRHAHVVAAFAPLSYTPPVITDYVPLSLQASFTGNLNFKIIGNTLRQGDSSPAVCTMNALSAAGDLDLPGEGTIAAPNSSVVAAWLYWFGSGDYENQPSGADFDTVSLIRPGASNVAIDADGVHRAINVFGTSTGYDYYVAYKDVSSLVSAEGDYNVANIDVDTGAPWSSADLCVGGWSLVAVYSNEKEQFRTVNIYDGIHPLSGPPSDSAIPDRAEVVMDNFRMSSTNTDGNLPNGQIGFVVMEGDRDEISGKESFGIQAEPGSSDFNVLTNYYNLHYAPHNATVSRPIISLQYLDPGAGTDLFYSIDTSAGNGGYEVDYPGEFTGATSTATSLTGISYGVDIDTFHLSPGGDELSYVFPTFTLAADSAKGLDDFGAVNAEEIRTVVGSGADAVLSAVQVFSVTSDKIADIEISLSERAPFIVDGTGIYDIVVQNNGDGSADFGAATGVITVTSTLPAGLSFADTSAVTGTDWSCTVATSPAAFTCEFDIAADWDSGLGAQVNGELGESSTSGVGEKLPTLSATVTIADSTTFPLAANTVTTAVRVLHSDGSCSAATTGVSPDPEGCEPAEYDNVNFLQGGEIDINDLDEKTATNNNVASLATSVTGVVSDLSIAKTLSAPLNKTEGFGSYLLRVTNLGPNATSQSFTVSDVVPSGLTLASVGGTGFTCTTVSNTASCTRASAAAELGVDDTADITVVVAVTGEIGDIVVNTASVTPESGALDDDLSNNSSTLTSSIIGTVPVVQDKFLISVDTLAAGTRGQSALAALSGFRDDDLVLYDPLTDTATLFFDDTTGTDTISLDNINAVHLLPNGHLLLSPSGSGTATGIGAFGPEDVVQYDPIAKTTTLVFDGSEIFDDPGENIDAIYFLDNGDLLFSTEDSASIGSLSWVMSDLIQYDVSESSANYYIRGNRSDMFELPNSTLLSGAYLRVNSSNATAVTDTLAFTSLNDFTRVGIGGDPVLGTVTTRDDIGEINIQTGSDTEYFSDNVFLGNSNPGIFSSTGSPNRDAVRAIDALHIVEEGYMGHFAITQSAAGSVCEVGKIKITKHQGTSHTSIDTDYYGSVIITTSTGTGDWALVAGSGTLDNGTSGDGEAVYTFVPSDNGVVELSLGITTVTTGLNVNVSNGIVTESASEDPNFNFATVTTTVQYLDEFTTSAFNNNDGLANWSGSWIEQDDADGVSGSNSGVGVAFGNVTVASGVMTLKSSSTATSGRDPSLARTADLSKFTVTEAVNLSYDFSYLSAAALDSVVVEASDDGTNWVAASTHTGLSGTSTASTAVTVRLDTLGGALDDFTGDVSVRFRVANGYTSGGSFSIDNVQLTTGTTDCSPIGIDHYAISHDGTGIMCLGSTITIVGHDASHNPAVVPVGEVMTLANNRLKGTWASIITGGGTLVDVGTAGAVTNTDGQGTYTWSGSEDTIQLRFNYTAPATDPETVNFELSGNYFEDEVTAGHDEDLSIAQAGLRFFNSTAGSEVIPTQLSAKPSNVGFGAATIQLQAVQSSDDDPSVCAALFPDEEVVTIEFAAECANPSSCASTSPAQSFTVNGTALGAALQNTNGAPGANNYQSISTTFGTASVGTSAPIVINYSDAGLMQLHARYNIPFDSDPEGVLSGDYLEGSTSFVVRPFGFDIDFGDDRADGTDATRADDATGTVYRKAGADFAATLTAARWQAADDSNNDGIPDADADLSDNGTTPNYGSEISTSESNAVVSHALEAPVAAKGSREGTLTGGSGFDDFTAAVATSNLSYSEAGIIDLSAELADLDYLGSGQNIQGNVQNVGRFIPDHFTLSSPSLSAMCTPGNDFTYMGEPFPVSFILEARNASGVITQNYIGDFTKLPASRFAPDSVFHGVQDVSAAADLDLTSRVQSIDSAFSIAWDDFGDSAPGTGAVMGTLVFNRENDGLLVDGAPDGPFALRFGTSVTDSDAVAITLSSTDIEVDDGVTEPGSPVYASLNASPIALRYGRLLVDNAFGPETEPLEIPLRVQYFDGTEFILNTDDSCTTVTFSVASPPLAFVADSFKAPASASNPLGAGDTEIEAGVTSDFTITLAGGMTGDTNIVTSGSDPDRPFLASAPSGGEVGSAIVELNLSYSSATDPVSFLTYDWRGGTTATDPYAQEVPDGANYTDNPRAIIEFGSYRSHDRILSWRELYVMPPE